MNARSLFPLFILVTAIMSGKEGDEAPRVKPTLDVRDFNKKTNSLGYGAGLVRFGNGPRNNVNRPRPVINILPDIQIMEEPIEPLRPAAPVIPELTEAQRLEQEKIRDELEKAEQDRIRIEQEKLEQERIKIEAQKLELEKIRFEREKAEQEKIRIELEKAEQERIRIEREKAELEKIRIELEIAEKKEQYFIEAITKFDDLIAELNNDKPVVTFTESDVIRKIKDNIEDELTFLLEKTIEVKDEPIESDLNLDDIANPFPFNLNNILTPPFFFSSHPSVVNGEKDIQIRNPKIKERKIVIMEFMTQRSCVNSHGRDALKKMYAGILKGF